MGPSTDSVVFTNRKNVNGEWLTALPDTASMLLEEEVEFIILASDGLWDWFKRYDQSIFHELTYMASF